MKGRRAKKGAVLATAVVFMTIIIALSVLVVVFASSSTKRAVNAAKRANSSIEMNLIADEFVTSVKDGHESYYKVDSTTSEEENGAGTETIRELPVATIDAHMNEFAQKINENYSCEVSVSASKTYSLKLIETSGEKKTQIMIVSVDVKENEIKDADGVVSEIKYTYSVVKWNLSDSDIAKLNVKGSFLADHMAVLAKDYLDFYFKMKNSELGFSADVYQLHIAELLQLNDTGLPQCYLTAETIEETGENDTKTEIKRYVAVATDNDNQEYVLFKYRLVEKTGEDKMPNLHIYVGEDEYVFEAKYTYSVNEQKGDPTIDPVEGNETIKIMKTPITCTPIYTYAVTVTKSSSDAPNNFERERTVTGESWTKVSSETIKITENSEAINGGNQ